MKKFKEINKMKKNRQKLRKIITIKQSEKMYQKNDFFLNIGKIKIFFFYKCHVIDITRKRNFKLKNN